MVVKSSKGIDTDLIGVDTKEIISAVDQDINNPSAGHFFL